MQKPLTSPIVREDEGDDVGTENKGKTLLSDEDATLSGSLTMRAAYISLDRLPYVTQSCVAVVTWPNQQCFP